MDRIQILAAFRSLAKSQGFYGRLLRDINDLKIQDPERYERAMKEPESKKFKDIVDLVLFIEG